MKRFTRFDGQLWHREGSCEIEVVGRPAIRTPVTRDDLCLKCLKLPDPDIPVLIDGFRGFGDAFYMKGPAVRLLREVPGRKVYVRTPWPQVFWDTPEIGTLNPGKTSLRTQDANASRIEDWAPEPRIATRVVLGYDARDFGKLSICESMEAMAGVSSKTTPDDYRVKVCPKWVKGWMKRLPRPLGVIHPPSVRREQKNPARAPKPQYMQTVVDARPDIFWVSVGWLKDKEEWLVGNPLERVSLWQDHGELSVEDLLGLISLADVAVTGPCWMFPAALALGTPLFGVFGGYAPPRTILNPLLPFKVACVAPDPFCACLKDDHDCEKWIGGDRVSEAFSRFMEEKCATR